MEKKKKKTRKSIECKLSKVMTMLALAARVGWFQFVLHRKRHVFNKIILLRLRISLFILKDVDKLPDQMNLIKVNKYVNRLRSPI